MGAQPPSLRAPISSHWLCRAPNFHPVKDVHLKLWFNITKRSARRSSLRHCHPSCPSPWTQRWSFPSFPFSCTVSAVRTVVHAGKKPQNSSTTVLVYQRGQHTTTREKRVVEEREAGAVVALAASTHGMRCLEQPQHPSGANKKTGGVGERGTTDFSGFWIKNSESKVIKAKIWLLTGVVTELTLPTASCIYGIT